MKNRLLVILLLFIGVCNAQIPFTKIFDDYRDIKPYEICEYNNNYYCLTALNDVDTNSQIMSCLYKIDRTGNLLDSIIIRDNNNPTYITNIEIINDAITLAGFSKTEVDTTFNIHVFRIDEDLEICNNYLYQLNGKRLFHLYSTHYSQGLVLSGRYTPTNGNYMDIVFMLINNQWEMSKVKIHNTYPGDMIYGITECNDTIYASVEANRINGSNFHVWRIDDNLNYNVICQTWNGSRYSSICTDKNNNLLLSGKDYILNQGTAIANYRYSTTGDLLDTTRVGILEVSDMPAVSNAISAGENHIFSLSYQGPDHAMIDWFSPFSVKACLYVMDYNLNVISESYLDDEVCYIACDVEATSDGGCIFIASRYDYQAGIQERDLVVVKTDSNGIFTWTTEIPLPDLPNGIYPNPAKEYIHIKDQFIPGTLQLFDINGKHVLESAAKNTVDISNFVSGNYVYRIINEKGIVTSAGKMVVE